MKAPCPSPPLADNLTAFIDGGERKSFAEELRYMIPLPHEARYVCYLCSTGLVPVR
jgi:hypothetical protein